MTELPHILKSGEIARLIPVIADSRKEQRVASVFLAALSAIPDFAEALLGTVGQRIGSRATVNSYTEVVLSDQPQAGSDRPDGLLVLDRGRSTWSALIEAKIGRSNLDSEQVGRYLQLARVNDLDAVITISNEFVARPVHSPAAVPKQLLRKVNLFHWSWKFILTEAILLQSGSVIKDPDQAFLLREFIRFLSHDSIGVSGFTQMPAEWKDVGTQLQSGAELARGAPAVTTVVSAWYQEIRDLTLRMSHSLSVGVRIKLPRAHESDPDVRFRDDCIQLADKQLLSANLQIPDAASDIRVCADLKGRSITVGMRVEAPQDRQRTSSRVNWLLRQLKHSPPENLYLRLFWPSRARDTVCALEKVREDVKAAGDDSLPAPRAFEVFYLSSDARRFAGRKTFIEDLESAVSVFYERVGQHLQPWRPKPPKPAKEAKPEEPRQEPQESIGSEVTAAAIKPEEKKPEEKTSAGNLHTSLLEIPSFLRRISQS